MTAPLYSVDTSTRLVPYNNRHRSPFCICIRVVLLDPSRTYLRFHNTDRSHHIRVTVGIASPLARTCKGTQNPLLFLCNVLLRNKGESDSRPRPPSPGSGDRGSPENNGRSAAIPAPNTFRGCCNAGHWHKCRPSVIYTRTAYPSIRARSDTKNVLCPSDV